MMQSKKTKASTSARKRKMTELPRSGLAEDVLPPAEVEAADAPLPAPPTGPEQLLEFADAVAAEGAHETEHKVEKLETWVTFDLAGEVFALPVTHVQEILRVSSITAVPHAPHAVRGVTNKRGRVLPVVDLRVRLDLDRVEITEASRILVVESRSRLLGLLVDGVSKVTRLARSAVQPPPPDVMTEQSEYILGVIELERLVILLDVDRLLIIDDDPATTPVPRDHGLDPALSEQGGER